MSGRQTSAVIAALSALVLGAPALADDAQTLAAIDIEYQAAVKRNDAEVMDRILHDEFVLVLGNGASYRKEDLLRDAREKKFVYELQDEEAGSQTVRVWGDTAVITAKLLLKYTQAGKSFQRKLWFSDTYVRTKDGWRYAFGQASLPLPE
jgi:ketosteroid isomerase-like protein